MTHSWHPIPSAATSMGRPRWVVTHSARLPASARAEMRPDRLPGAHLPPAFCGDWAPERPGLPGAREAAAPASAPEQDAAAAVRAAHGEGGLRPVPRQRADGAAGAEAA